MFVSGQLVDEFDSNLTIGPVCTTLPCVVMLTCSFNLTEETFRSILVVNLGSRRILYAQDMNDPGQFDKHESVIDASYDLSPAGSGLPSSLNMRLAIQACDHYNHRCKVVATNYAASSKIENVPFQGKASRCFF